MSLAGIQAIFRQAEKKPKGLKKAYWLSSVIRERIGEIHTAGPFSIYVPLEVIDERNYFVSELLALFGA
jgi:hypothetical protein